jgi:hypothetical protein
MITKIFILIPLTDNKRKTKSQMFRVLDRKPKYLPRIGEQIFIQPNLNLKVVKIIYSGLFLRLIRIELEPVPSKYKETLLAHRQGRKDDWQFDGGYLHHNEYQFTF